MGDYFSNFYDGGSSFGGGYFDGGADPYSNFYGGLDNTNSYGGGNSLGDAFDPYSNFYGGTDNGETLGGGGTFQGAGLGSFQPGRGFLPTIPNGGFSLASLFPMLAPVIGGAVDAVRQGDASKDMMNWMNGQMGKTDNLYAPNSPEYNALWDQMSRMDAASGRNSQYGPRSVDLAAKIAPIRAQSALGMTNALAKPYADTLRQNAGKYTGLFQGLGQLFSPFANKGQPQQSGGGDGGFGDFLGAVGSIIGFL